MRNNPFIYKLISELRYVLLNPSLFLIIMMAPLFYGLFYAFPYEGETPEKVPVAVVDLDKTSMSRTLTKMLDDSQELTTLPAPVFEYAKQMFYDRQVYSVIIIPKGFERKILRGEQANIALYSDGGYILYYKQVYAGTQLAASTFGAGITIQKLQSAGVPAEVAYKQRTSVTINSVPLFNPAGGYATYVLPAVFILICHQLTIIALAMTAGYERRDKINLKNLTAADDTVIRFSVKVLLGLILMTFQLLFLYGVVLQVFHIPFNGEITDLIVALVPFMLSVIFAGLTAGSFVKNPETVILYVAVTSIPLLFLSGYPWASSSIPTVLRFIANLLPSTHAISAAVRIYREGAQACDVAYNIKALWALTAFFFTTTMLRLKKL